VAIWTQALWAVLLVLYLQNFHDITAFVVFDSFLFYALTVAAVYRLRLSKPDHPRPYRCGGYPFTPVLFVLFSLGFIAALLLDPTERKHALIGLGILAAGMPYYLWQQRQTRRPLGRD
jgi:APA family basic amino acid/polyamine antiporter